MAEERAVLGQPVGWDDVAKGPLVITTVERLIVRLLFGFDWFPGPSPRERMEGTAVVKAHVWFCRVARGVAVANLLLLLPAWFQILNWWLQWIPPGSEHAEFYGVPSTTGMLVFSVLVTWFRAQLLIHSLAMADHWLRKAARG